jgi:catechol 2,3-dioxygenase-like lactoylglutathione lyase family enzyme
MSVTEMDHVLVLAQDIERTRDFYRMIGLRVGERPPLEFPGYWMYAGPTPCLHIADRGAYRAHAAGLGLHVADGQPAPGPVDHIAFTASDYEGLSDRLERAGVAAVHNTVAAAELLQLFVEDPNGVRVEINVRRSQTQER